MLLKERGQIQDKNWENKLRNHKKIDTRKNICEEILKMLKKRA